jgi:hypothetical protein
MEKRLHEIYGVSVWSKVNRTDYTDQYILFYLLAFIYEDHEIYRVLN